MNEIQLSAVQIMAVALVLARILLCTTLYIVGNYEEVHYLPLERNAGELFI